MSNPPGIVFGQAFQCAQIPGGLADQWRNGKVMFTHGG
jgi:hypothetical protein